MYINGDVKIKGYTRVEDIDSGECFTFLDDDELYMKTDDCAAIIRMCDGAVCDYDEDRPVEPIDTELKIIDKKKTKSEFHSIEKMNSLYSIPIPETIRFALDLDIDDLVMVKLTENGEIVIRTEKEK